VVFVFLRRVALLLELEEDIVSVAILYPKYENQRVTPFTICLNPLSEHPVFRDNSLGGRILYFLLVQDV